MISLLKRPRRNRKSAAIRALVRETSLSPADLVAPLFVIEGTQKKETITSMPGIWRLSTDLLIEEITYLSSLGIGAVALFPVIPRERKDEMGSEACAPNSLIYRSSEAIKTHFPDLCLITDIALDPYTDHGHDGLLDGNGDVANDATVEKLCEMALLAAQAGVDVVAPSDMMDGRIGAIRRALDGGGYQGVSILSYAAKYASSFYGPFREALQSAPKRGDKSRYQMDPANSREALLECLLDISEGADMLLIKPALPYLDVVTKVREISTLPVGAYQVSGEYAMAMAAGQLGWLDAEAILAESLLAIKRAGADFIITYAARQMAEKLNRGAGL